MATFAADNWRHLGHVTSSNMHDAMDAVINLLVKLTTSCVHWVRLILSLKLRYLNLTV